MVHLLAMLSLYISIVSVYWIIDETWDFWRQDVFDKCWSSSCGRVIITYAWLLQLITHAEHNVDSVLSGIYSFFNKSFENCMKKNHIKSPKSMYTWTLINRHPPLKPRIFLFNIQNLQDNINIIRQGCMLSISLKFFIYALARNYWNFSCI